jgi:aspartokinase
MSKIRLGGVKVVERRAYLYSSCRSEVDPLGNLCSILAADKVNIGLLTHVGDNGYGESITAASAKSSHCFSGYILRVAGSDARYTAETEGDISRISIFPHNQRPEIAGSLITILEAGAIRPYGIASSPSAVTVVLSSSDLETAMERLFDFFEFPACTSYGEWQAVYRMDEHQLSAVRFSYSEHIVTIYGFTSQTGLDLWNLSVQIESMGGFGAFLSQLGELGFKLPFLVSHSAPAEKVIHFSFTLDEGRRELANEALDRCLPARNCYCRRPVSLIFVHGPHFGDRYGIADAFVSALRDGGIPVLALSCAVSSISAVIEGNEPDKAVGALSARFQTPRGGWR